MLAPLLKRLQQYGYSKSSFFYKKRPVSLKNPLIFTAIAHTKQKKTEEDLEDFFDQLHKIPFFQSATMSDIFVMYQIDLFSDLNVVKGNQWVDLIDRIQQLTAWCYASLDPSHGHEDDDPIKIIETGYALCAGYVVVMAYLCDLDNITYRLWRLVVNNFPRGRGIDKMDTHEVLEIYYENKWILVDPTTNIIFPYSLHELCMNPSLADDVVLSNKRNDARWNARFYELYISSALYKNIFSLGVREAIDKPFFYVTKEEFLKDYNCVYKNNVEMYEI